MIRLWRAWRGTREVLRHLPAMSQEKLLEALGVELDHPMLVATLNVLAGMEEIGKENVAVLGIDDRERTYHAAWIAVCAEAQERILNLAIQGRNRKAGKK